MLTLRELGHTVTLYFSNANIAPHSEFEKRLRSVEHLAKQLQVEVVVDAPDHQDWYVEVAQGFEDAPERGARCERCFKYSLRRTYQAMSRLNCDAFTTTLTVSPHKISSILLQTGRELDANCFLPLDFKKRDGFKRSLLMASEYQLYRQNYCGCEFSAL